MREPERVQSTPMPYASSLRAVDDAPAAFRAAFERRLRTDGPTGALALLNHRTRFRFTGLFRVAPPRLCNVSLYDRENPWLNVSGEVRTLADTLCSIVYESGRALRVVDAPADLRLRAHPARESVQSYAGVPVRLPGGRMIGTLCHFDPRPRLIPPDELAVLQGIAPLLLPWLAVDEATPG